VRYFLIIISFYLLALPFVPCSDARDCETAAVATSQIEQEQHEEHEDEEESCTPFCYCACCTYSTILPYQQAIAQLLPSFTSPSGDITTDLLAFESFAIWQPPRMNEPV